MSSDCVIVPYMNSLLLSKPQIQSREKLVTAIDTYSLTTVVPVSALCLGGQYCIMQGPVREEDIDISSPLAACKAPSRTMKASKQGKFPG